MAKMKKRVHLSLQCFIALLISILVSSCNQLITSNLVAKGLIDGQSFEDEDVQDIYLALQEMIQGREDILAFLIYEVSIDHVDFSADRNLALVWLSLIDPGSSQIVPAESGLVIAKRLPVAETEKRWQIILQADSNWAEVLRQIPNDMLDEDIREQYMPGIQSIPHVSQTFSGYRLPWEAGESKRLSGSIGHVYTYKTCPSSCLYAFDFADGTMWPVLAAKGGRVKYAVWQYPNGNTKHANYIVLEDTTTNPTTYQVYMHLAQDSIPQELRTPGAKVVQGQKIGVADDTGVSSGHHLHFHVHTNPERYWGNSVDITFDDVKINGGRPRTCLEARLYPKLGKECQAKDLYTSGNTDNQPPSGVIKSPKDGAVITTQSLSVKAKAEDDTGIASFQLLLSIDGNWQKLGEPTNQNKIQTTLDLCEMQVPDGQFFLALEIIDKAGKQAEGLPGMITLRKQYACPAPPPLCEASDNQVAVFDQPDFGGDCRVLEIGDYSGPYLADTYPLSSIASIQVDDGVYLEMYENRNQADASYILTKSAMNLAEFSVSFPMLEYIRVIPIPPPPLQPNIHIETSDLTPTLTDEQSITLRWDPLDPSAKYRVQLFSGNKVIQEMDWSKKDHWEIGTLSPGDYSFTLEVKNISGMNSLQVQFNVKKTDLPPVTRLLDLPAIQKSNAIHLQWVLESGDNDIRDFQVQYRQDEEDWEDWNTGIPGQLRDAVFVGEMGHRYEFRIRGIDLAGNIELYSDNPQASTAVEDQCQPDVYDTEYSDNQRGDSTVLELEQVQLHNICGPGDVDWLAFPAQKDQVYKIQISPSEPLYDFALQVFGANTSEILAQAHTNAGDSLELKWTSPRNGIFYLRISSFDPRLSGSSVKYQLMTQQVLQVNTPTLFFSTFVLPIIWSLFKVFSFLRKKYSSR
jgi:murein DD-endopeptidase MepM/ murein hydrolase activator NlpD